MDQHGITLLYCEQLERTLHSKTTTLIYKIFTHLTIYRSTFYLVKSEAHVHI